MWGGNKYPTEHNKIKKSSSYKRTISEALSPWLSLPVVQNVTTRPINDEPLLQLSYVTLPSPGNIWKKNKFHNSIGCHPYNKPSLKKKERAWIYLQHCNFYNSIKVRKAAHEK